MEFYSLSDTFCPRFFPQEIGKPPPLPLSLVEALIASTSCTMGGGGDEGGTGDKRVEYLRDRVVPLLKIKPELFDAYCKTEEGELIKRFVSDGNCTKIFFSAGAKDMAATEKMPDDKQTKKKAVFAMKLGEDIKFDEKKLDEMFDKCVVADLSPAVLNNLYNTLRSVYLPILTNPGFINGKPGIVMKQFVDKYNWMLAAVHTAIGQTQGKTALWLPPVEGPSGGGGNKDRSDKDRVHVLESAVVMWTERINTVRAAASAQRGCRAAASACHPGLG
jgi:hypothetical protein